MEMKVEPRAAQAAQTVKSVTILGSTGSIGVNTLRVVSQHPGRFTVHALTAHRNMKLLAEQCRIFTPRHAVVMDAGAGLRNSSVKSLSLRPDRQARRISSLKPRSPVGEVPPFREVRMM